MRADARANRTALIVTAQQLIAERGSTDVPFRTIAQEAGVGIGTLYRHFPDHEELIDALVEDARERVISICERHRKPMRNDPETAWREVVDELTGSYAASFMPALVAGATKVPASLLRARQDITAAVAELLLPAKAAGLVPANLDADRFLLGIVIITRPLPRPSPVEVEGMRQWMAQVYQDGLRAQTR